MRCLGQMLLFAVIAIVPSSILGFCAYMISSPMAHNAATKVRDGVLIASLCFALCFAVLAYRFGIKKQKPKLDKETRGRGVTHEGGSQQVKKTFPFPSFLC